MDIHRNPRISKWIFKDNQMGIQGYPNGYSRISKWIFKGSIQIDIHKSMGTRRLISVKHAYPLIGFYFYRHQLYTPAKN